MRHDAIMEDRDIGRAHHLITVKAESVLDVIGTLPLARFPTSVDKRGILAIDGGAPGFSGALAAPGATMLGWGRALSCTREREPGMIGVSS